MRRTARCYEHFMRRFSKLCANCAWRTSFLTTGTGGVCLCVGFDRVGGVGGEWVGPRVGGEWVGRLDQGREWWGAVMSV